MGNRAVIAFGGSSPKTPGLYLHWNGGQASVEAFLEVGKKLGCEFTPGNAAAQRNKLAKIIKACFFKGSSVYVDELDKLDCDNGDNGVYEIDGSLRVVKRWGDGSESEPEINPAKTAEIVDGTLAKAKELGGDVIAKTVVNND
jgi:hypothetical protein